MPPRSRIAVAIVTWLLAFPAASGAQDLRKAIVEGELADVQAALARKPSLNATDARGWTLLMRLAVSSRKAQVEKARALLDAGASLEAVNNEGETVLIVATGDSSNLAIVRLLIERGANVNAARKDGRTALMEAASNLDTEEILALLNAGARIDAADNNGNTALIEALRRARLPGGGSDEYDRSLEGRILKTIEPLLTNGASPNATNKKGERPLSIIQQWFDESHLPAIGDRLRKAGAR